MRSIRILLFAALLPLQLSAQAAAVDSSARSAAGAIPIGASLRIQTVGNSFIEGRLASRSDTGIVIRQNRDSAHVSIDRIAAVWRPVTNTKRYAAAGLVTGGVLGALYVGALAAGLCETASCHGAFAQGAVPGLTLGGLLGAAIGAGVGSVTHHWKRVSP